MIFQHLKDAMRTGLKAAGIILREPEEKFYIGQTNYSKRVKGLTLVGNMVILVE
jgi:hypothetical protein